MGKRGPKNNSCDDCVYYRWYYDWCEKWKCEVDSRSICKLYMSVEEASELIQEKKMESIRKIATRIEVGDKVIEFW